MLIPTIYGVEELKRCLRAIKQVEKLNHKIVVVANAMKASEFEEVKELITAESGRKTT